MTATHMPHLPTCHDCGDRPGYKERRVTCKRCLSRVCSSCFREGGHTRAAGVRPDRATVTECKPRAGTD